jgi:hypothetical protein
MKDEKDIMWREKSERKGGSGREEGRRREKWMGSVVRWETENAWRCEGYRR